MFERNRSSHFVSVPLHKLTILSIMSRKGKNTSFNLRQLIVFNRAQGKTYREIAHLFKVKKSTVYDVCKRFDHEGRLNSIPQKGRPRKLTPCDERFIMKEVKKNPTITASKLSSQFLRRFDFKIHPQTIRCIIKKNCYNSRAARRKPLINEQNRKKRLQFAIR